MELMKQKSESELDCTFLSQWTELGAWKL